MGKGPLSRFLSQDLHQLVAQAFAGWFALCILLLFAKPVPAQTCPLEKLQAKSAEIENELLPRMGAVRLHRVEDLEDDVFIRKSGSSSVLQIFALSKSSKAYPPK